MNRVRPFKFKRDSGEESVVFLPVTPLGNIAYDGEGNVGGWCFDAEPNTEVSYLVGEKLPKAKSTDIEKIILL